jgi:hypothetical protein
MTTDHIEARGRTMYCTRCECTSTVQMPALIDHIIAQMDFFRDAHKDCKPNATETQMSEYIKGFDAGCEHLMREIELFNRQAHLQPALVPEVLKHLRKGLK